MKNISKLKKGINFIETKVYSNEEDELIMKLFEGLHLAGYGRFTWSRICIRPGGNELESVSRSIIVGGVLVCPSDVVVANEDGVVVVRQERAEQVTKYTREILVKDKGARKDLYKKVGIPEDQTVK